MIHYQRRLKIILRNAGRDATTPDQHQGPRFFIVNGWEAQIVILLGEATSSLMALPSQNSPTKRTNYDNPALTSACSMLEDYQRR